jgi:type IV pilus assembly protein PilN
MRVPINLASEPFRRKRATVVITSICAVALLALAGVQTYLILAERERASENRGAVAALTQQLNTVNREQAAVDATLRQPENAAVLEQSILLNALIERKSISWSRLLSDIEGVLPNGARLVQIRLPQINSRNEVTLDMEVGTQQEMSAIDFTTKLQESPLFGPATLLRSDPPSQTDPLYRYRLTVSYAQKL